MITVSFKRPEPGEVICVGSFDFQEGRLNYDVQAEHGAGLFIGVYEEEGITQQSGVLWLCYEIEHDIPLVTAHVESSTEPAIEGAYYVYVGCSELGKTLTDISGTITYGE